MANILCAGIAAVDEVFRVRAVPVPDTKVGASEFITVSGGCAANGALAIARLGGKACFAGPLGGPGGSEVIGDQVVDGLQRDGVECIGCVRVSGARTTVSVILIDDRGDRTIATFRDHRLDQATVE